MIVQAQVVIPMFTNIPKDVISNTFHFDVPVWTLAEAADEIAIRLDAFYTYLFTQEVNYAASYVSWANAMVKCYNIADPTPRVPEDRAMPITPSGTVNTEIPTEVSCVLSFHANPISGVAAARLRNRIYIGGLAEGAILPGSGSTFPMFGSSFCEDLVAAGEQLLALNDGNMFWVQYSPTRADSELIAGFWVDNSIDTQRRRGITATARYVS